MISQREARRLRKRVTALEAILRTQRATWVKDWPGGIPLGVFACPGDEIDAGDIRVIETIRRLGHAVVLTVSENVLYLNALPVEKP